MYTPSPDIRTLRTLAALNKDEGFTKFLELWKVSVAGALANANDMNTALRAQGAIRVLDSLVEHLQTAEKAISRKK